MRITHLVFDGVDLLDLGGPYEVFLTANRMAERDGAPAPFDVVVTSIAGAGHPAHGGLGLVPTHAALADLDRIDVLLVPGLIDVDRAVADPGLIDGIRAAAGRAETVVAVCTGAFLLARAGLLVDVPATTHFADVEELGRHVGAGRVLRRRWVDAGRIVTSGGLSSGIAMSLHLVRRFASMDLALRTARQLEYDWDPQAGLTLGPGSEDAGRSPTYRDSSSVG